MLPLPLYGAQNPVHTWHEFATEASTFCCDWRSCFSSSHALPLSSLWRVGQVLFISDLHRQVTRRPWQHLSLWPQELCCQHAHQQPEDNESLSGTCPEGNAHLRCISDQLRVNLYCQFSPKWASGVNFLKMPTCCALLHVEELNYVWIKRHQEMHPRSTPKALHIVTSTVWTYQVQLPLLGWIIIHVYIAWSQSREKPVTWMSTLQDGVAAVHGITAISKNCHMKIQHGDGCIPCTCHAQNLRTVKS